MFQSQYQILFLLFLSINWIACSSSQKLKGPEKKGLYSEFLDSEEKEISTSYQEMISKRSDSVHIHRIFRPDKRQMTHLTEYKDGKRTIKHGRHERYYDNGTPEVIGQYRENQKVGDWKYYHNDASGHIKIKGQYIEGERSGNWKYYDDTEQLTKVTSFVNNQKHGTVQLFDSLGQITCEIEYEKGDQVSPSEACPETEPKNERPPIMYECRTISDPKERESCSMRTLLTSIYKNIRYPVDAREKNIQGMAQVKFVVTREGDIEDPRVIRGLNHDIEAELLRIIPLLPRWEPGYQNGKPVRVSYDLPVKFQMQ